MKREISIMKLVRHPYVVQLREVLASSSKIFLVCELITGGELFDKIVEKQVKVFGLISTSISIKQLLFWIDDSSMYHTHRLINKSMVHARVPLKSKL